MELKYKHNGHMYYVQPHINSDKKTASVLIKKDGTTASCLYDASFVKTLIRQIEEMHDVTITWDDAINIAFTDRGITLEDLHETDLGMIGKPRKTDVQLVNLDDGTPAYIVTVCCLHDAPERTYTVGYCCTYTISAADGTIIDKNIEGAV